MVGAVDTRFHVDFKVGCVVFLLVANSAVEFKMGGFVDAVEITVPVKFKGCKGATLDVKFEGFGESVEFGTVVD